MDGPSLLSDVKPVGVSIALVGSVIAAPTGTRLLWHSATDRLRRRSCQMQVR